MSSSVSWPLLTGAETAGDLDEAAPGCSPTDWRPPT